jgi:hypothetical protein
MINIPVNRAVAISKNTVYLNKDITYLKNVRITEWDIHAAGLSVIKYKKLLSDEEIAKLEAMPKEERTIKEGLLQKSHPEIVEIILDTLMKAREAFVVVNSIDANNILSIKKDAFFLINQRPKLTQIKTFDFKEKNTYTSYLYLNNKEFYYNSSMNTLEIKGLSDTSKISQENYILADIKRFMKLGEKLDSENLFKILKKYRSDYLNKILDVNTYRELDNDGKFRVDNMTFEEINPSMIDDLDISQNYINYILSIFNYMI